MSDKKQVGKADLAIDESDKKLVKALVLRLQEKYSVNREQVGDIIRTLDFAFPISIFSAKTGSFEAIVKYLHENESLGFSQIARLTNRHPSTINLTYQG